MRLVYKYSLITVLALAVALLIAVLPAAPVFAASNPDSISIGDVFVFTNLTETNDQLFFVRYDVSYSPEPPESAEDTWLMAIYDTDGTTILYTRPLNYYQHNIISIYLTPAQALTWGTSYKVRIMGSPCVFLSLVEGVNMRTYTLGAGDYVDDVDEFGLTLLNQAQILEDDWGVSLLSASDLLNTTGSFYFREAIPNLNSIAPEIFQTTVGYPEGFDRVWTNAYATLLEAHAGPNLIATFTGLGTLLGVSWRWAAFWVICIGYLTVAGTMYSVTKNSYFSLLMPFPMVITFVWLGILHQNVILLIVFIVAIMFGIYFILQRFA